MPADDEPRALTDADRELRTLQRKAYGRDGGLTDAEAQRLRALEDVRSAEAPRGTAPGAAPGADAAPAADTRPAIDASSAADTGPADASSAIDASPSVDTSPADGARSAEPAAAAAPTHAEGARPEPDGGASPAVLASWRMMLRPRWKSAAAASALLLGVGVGIGWAAFAPHPQAFPLSTDEVHRQLALSEKGGYDAGSVRPAARDGDALVWFATKTAQNLDCIILDVGEQSSANCVPADEGDLFQLSASVFIRDSDDTSGGGTSVSAYGMTATNGERLVSVQRWNPNESMLAQFEGDERVRAEALIADGYFPGLSLLGEFRGSPVWYAQRDGQAGWIDACVIVDATGDVSCRAEDGADDKEYTVEGADPQGAPWSVQVRLTRWGAPYLTITEGPTAARTVVIDTKSGDPIEVTTPLSDPDG